MRSLLSRWWSEVRRYLACSPWLVALALALPAGAQPTNVPDLLTSMNCRTANVCATSECKSHQVGAYDPSIIPPTAEVYWPRYGFQQRPLHISDGCHGCGGVEARAVLEKLWGRQLTVVEWHDLSKVYCGKLSARAVVIDRFGAPVQPCGDGGWVCGPSMPLSVVERCLTGETRCTGTDYGTSVLCYLDKGRRVFYNTRRPECVPAAAPPPPPPPPEPRCGDGKRDAGETCLSCPADMPAGACEPEPPVETGCAQALDAHLASQAATWAVVERQCRR